MELEINSLNYRYYSLLLHATNRNNTFVICFREEIYASVYLMIGSIDVVNVDL